MKIGMILDKEFPPDSRVENEAKQLIKNGHEIHLFCLNFGTKQTKEIINGINVHRYSFPKKLFMKTFPLAYTIPIYHYYLKKRVKKFIAQLDFDAIHVHDMVAPKVVFDLDIKIPIVLDLHENRPAIMEYYTHVNSGLGKLLIDLEKWEKIEFQLIQKADKIVVVTQEAKNYYLEKVDGIANDKIVCAPNTIDTNIFLNYKINDKIVDKFNDYFTILYLGAINIRRGLDTVIKAVAKLKDHIPNINFVMVGSESRDIVTLKKMVSEYHVTDSVSFEGWKDLSLFPSYIKASDLCISPIKRNLHHDTTIANKLFQYMSVGRPVIVSDCPPQIKVVEEEKCGFVFKADDVNDLCDKILKLYKDKDMREFLGNNGKKSVQNKYNWDITGKELIDLYKSLKSGK